MDRESILATVTIGSGFLAAVLSGFATESSQGWVWFAFGTTAVLLSLCAAVALRSRSESSGPVRTIGSFLFVMAAGTVLFPTLLPTLGPVAGAAGYVTFIVAFAVLGTEVALVRAKRYRRRPFIVLVLGTLVSVGFVMAWFTVIALLGNYFGLWTPWRTVARMSPLGNRYWLMLQGQWVGRDDAGQPVSVSFCPTVVRLNSTDVVLQARYFVDGKRTPAHLDLDAGRLGKVETIFQIEGGRLTMEEAFPGEPRPTRFAKFDVYSRTRGDEPPACYDRLPTVDFTYFELRIERRTPGWGDWLVFSHKTRSTLLDVNVSVTLAFENTKQQSVDRFWATWGPSDRKEVQFLEGWTAGRLQGVTLRGTGVRGGLPEESISIDAHWRF